MKASNGVNRNVVVFSLIGIFSILIAAAYIMSSQDTVERQNQTGEVVVVEDQELELQRVREKRGSFVFLNSQVNVSKGETERLYVKIENNGEDAFEFRGFEFLADNESTIYLEWRPGMGVSSDTETMPVVRVLEDIFLMPGETGTYIFEVEADSGLDQGTYYGRFDIDLPDVSYTRTISVQVK